LITRWFAKRNKDGEIRSVFRATWDSDRIRPIEHYWDFRKLKWVASTEVFYVLYVWNNDLEEVDFEEVRHLLPPDLGI